MLKQDDHGELCTFTDSLEHSINCLKDSGQHNIGTFITSLITNKFHKKMNKLLLNYTRDIKKVPDEDTLLQFLYICITPVSVSSPFKMDLPKEHAKRIKAPVHHVQSQEPREARETCILCGGERHLLYLCPTSRPCP